MFEYLNDEKSPQSHIYEYNHQLFEYTIFQPQSVQFYAFWLFSIVIMQMYSEETWELDFLPLLLIPLCESPTHKYFSTQQR